MKIRVWGCRGSLPAPGPRTLRYGGNTTCLDVSLRDGRHLIIDAGSGLRLLGKELAAQDRCGFCLLLTHAHWDHLMGFPFFAPGYDKRFVFNVCGGPQAQKALHGYLMRQMEAPYFPVSFDAMKAQFRFGCTGPCDVTTMALNHPNGGRGFKIAEDGKQFAFIPDTEIGFSHPGGASRDELIEFCRGVDVLFHDAQYDDAEYASQTRGWGHSTFASATALAIEAGVKQFGLFHHDPDRSDEALDAQLALCRERIARSGAATQCFVVAEGMQIDL